MATRACALHDVDGDGASDCHVADDNDVQRVDVFPLLRRGARVPLYLYDATGTDALAALDVPTAALPRDPSALLVLREAAPPRTAMPAVRSKVLSVRLLGVLLALCLFVSLISLAVDVRWRCSPTDKTTRRRSR